MVVSCATIPDMKEHLLPKLLENRGLRPADLARLLDVDKATITRWSQKEVPADRLADVVRVTGISATDLRPDLAVVFATAPDVEPAA